MAKYGAGYANTLEVTAEGFLITQDFVLASQRDQIDGYSILAKFGRNSDIDTGGFEDVWDAGETWVAPTEDRIHDLVSTEAADASASTGAKTVEVYGLSGGTLTSETVSMGGTVNAPTTNAYGMIHRMVVATAGTVAANAGTITATAQTDDTVTAQISPGNNQTLMAIYQIPSDKTGYVFRWYADMNRSVTTGASDTKLLVKPDGGVFQTKRYNGLVAAGSSSFDKTINFLTAGPLSIVKIAADASANNTSISAGFDIILVDN